MVVIFPLRCTHILGKGAHFRVVSEGHVSWPEFRVLLNLIATVLSYEREPYEIYKPV